jgi:hypothetical protein
MRGRGGELNREVEVLEALDKAAGGGGLVPLVEVVGAEILVERPVLEHVVDAAQNRAPIDEGVCGLVHQFREFLVAALAFRKGTRPCNPCNPHHRHGRPQCQEANDQTASLIDRAKVAKAFRLV